MTPETLAAIKAAHEAGYRAAINFEGPHMYRLGWDAALHGQQDLIKYLGEHSKDGQIAALQGKLSALQSKLEAAQIRIAELEAAKS